ncbi:MAG: tRNA (adenosine(37)-N6)-dimethylallyltransferase MiaA [Parcubacteria group bacterium]
MPTKNKPTSSKIIVLLGPTASGKSSAAILLAKKFNGEILSADSRQIYRGMDIGTGKVEKDSNSLSPVLRGDVPMYSSGQRGGFFISEGIPHYAIDIVSPKTDYSVAKFKKYADKVIADIFSRGKVPIIAGGTGFWIKAIVDDITYPEVAPDPVLRSMLRNKTTEELFAQLEKLDPERAKNIDAKNPVRLIRAIEICKAIGKVPKPMRNYETTANLRTKQSFVEFVDSHPKFVDSNRAYDFLQIGILREKEELHERIRLNVKKRFAAGMIEEVSKLHAAGLSWKKMESFGLSYKLIPQFLRGEIGSEEDLLEKIYLAEKDYAKRQMTWFKKDARIVWLEKYPEIEKEVKLFLEK